MATYNAANTNVFTIFSPQRKVANKVAEEGTSGV